MNGTIYDVFISYRRDGGFETANGIYERLEKEGYSISFDVDTLREGRFNKQLFERIEQCIDFILIVDKDAFNRTIDSATDPEDDWLRQELAYAIRLKKNIIPILLPDAKFPREKELPEDVKDVRDYQGPRYSKDYYRSFYEKLKSYMHALPRNAETSKDKFNLKVKADMDCAFYFNGEEKASLKAGVAKEVHLEQGEYELRFPHNAMLSTDKPCLKLKADMDCIFYLDGEEKLHLKAGVIQKMPLSQGEYELRFVSVENAADVLEVDFKMPDVDKLQKMNLCAVRDNRIAEEKRRYEEVNPKERIFNVGNTSFKMIRIDGGRIGTFYIGETQVTQALWRAVMGNKPSHFKSLDHPVECVSWNDICGKDGTGTDQNCFIYKLNQKIGLAFRLPKEAEWEYAAMGGNKSKNYTYAGSDDIDEVAWYWKNSGDKYLEGRDDDYDRDKIKKNYSKTHPVKQKTPNELGIFDMSGNVWEWCEDLYDSKGSSRVLRGGSWFSDARGCRVSSRGDGVPSNWCNYVGFRIVLPQ